MKAKTDSKAPQQSPKPDRTEGARENTGNKVAVKKKKKDNGMRKLDISDQHKKLNGKVDC